MMRPLRAIGTFVDVLIKKLDPDPIPESDNPDGRTVRRFLPVGPIEYDHVRDDSLPRREPRPRPYEEAPNQWRKPTDDEG